MKLDNYECDNQMDIFHLPVTFAGSWYCSSCGQENVMQGLEKEITIRILKQDGKYLKTCKHCGSIEKLVLQEGES